MTQVPPDARPWPLSILCGLGFFGCFLKMVLVISPVVQSYGRLYAVYLSLSSVLMIACLCGLWLMKRWALWTFLFYVLFDQAVYWQMGHWEPKVGLLNGLLLAMGFLYYRRFKA